MLSLLSQSSPSRVEQYIGLWAPVMIHGLSFLEVTSWSKIILNVSDYMIALLEYSRTSLTGVRPTQFA